MFAGAGPSQFDAVQYYSASREIPALRVTFFSDLAQPASSTGGSEAMLADVLNVSQKVDPDTLARRRSKINA